MLLCVLLIMIKRMCLDYHKANANLYYTSLSKKIQSLKTFEKILYKNDSTSGVVFNIFSDALQCTCHLDKFIICTSNTGFWLVCF